MHEIELPKGLSRIILDGAEETRLGDKKGAKKQYRSCLKQQILSVEC